MISNFAIDLDAAGVSVTLQGSIMGSVEPYAVITDDEIKGLYSTPTAKTSLTERQTANGAHDIAEQDILYSARTVTVDFAIISDGQGTCPNTSLYDLRTRFGMLAGHKVRMTVRDQGRSTFVTGYAEIEWSGRMRSEFDTGTLTLTCPRPERLSVQPHEITLWPTSTGNLGLIYKSGLAYPLSYGKQATDDRSVGILTNAGSILSYPVLTAYGDFGDGVQVDWSDSDGRAGSLWWKGQVGQVPLTLDCRSRTASMGGVDRSAGLARRSFPSVPAAGSLTLALKAGGTGYITCSSRDAWI